MEKQAWYKRLVLWIRLILSLISLLVMFFCLGLIIYGSHSTSNDLAFGIIAVLTALFALGQWLFPLRKAQFNADNQNDSIDESIIPLKSVVKPVELEQNLQMQGQIIPQTPSPLSGGPSLQKALVRVSEDQYLFTDFLNALNNVIENYELLIKQLPSPSVERAFYMNKLCQYLREHYARTKSVDDLIKIKELHEQMIVEIRDAIPKVL